MLIALKVASVQKEFSVSESTVGVRFKPQNISVALALKESSGDLFKHEQRTKEYDKQTLIFRDLNKMISFIFLLSFLCDF